MDSNRKPGIWRLVRVACAALAIFGLAATSSASAQADTGTISGAVLDPGGTPIAGVPVCAFGFDSYDLISCVQSGADGSYLLSGLVAGDYRVEASAAGWAYEMYDNLHYGLLSSATRVTLTAGADTPDIDFSLEPGGSVSGTVYESDGETPIAGISVMVVFPDGSSRGTCSEADGRFAIGRIVYGVPLVVHALSVGNFCSGPEGFTEEYWQESASSAGATALTLSAGTPDVEGLVFTLDELAPTTGAISGNVADGGDSPIPEATVCAFAFASHALTRCVQPGAGGEFVIAELPGGEYRVEVSAEGWAFEMYDDYRYGDVTAATPVPVTAGGTTPGIDFSLEPGGAVSGTVYQSDAATPIVGAAVMAVFPDGSSRGECTDSGGQFSIGNLPLGVEFRVHAFSVGSSCAGLPEHAEEYWEEAPTWESATALSLSSGTPSLDELAFTLDALTPLGDDVTISPAAGMTINFDSVTQAGQTSAHAVPVGPPEVSADYQVMGTYYEISTTAEFTTAQVCFNYDDAALSQADEEKLGLHHYEDGHWADITDDGYPDPENNYLCGTVSQFSPFAILLWLDRAPMADAGPDIAASEGDLVTLDAGASADPDDDISLYEWDLDGDGFYDAVGRTISVAFPDDWSALGALQVTDDLGLTDTDAFQITISNVAPQILTLSGPVAPVALGTPVEVRATFVDPGMLDTFTATWSWGDGSTSEGLVTGQEVSGTHTYAAAGTYILELSLTDDDGGTAVESYPAISVYGPNRGSATGGGLIRGPNHWRSVGFAFNARYHKDASGPSGNAVVVMPGRVFHSTSYESLVVSGSRAQLQGRGRLNGRSGYAFLLSVVDGPGRHGQDTIRIRIWNERTGAVVYDSQPGDPMDAVPTGLVRFGSIHVHTR